MEHLVTKNSLRSFLLWLFSAYDLSNSFMPTTRKNKKRALQALHHQHYVAFDVI